MDENLNDAVVDFAIAFPSMLVACLHRTFAPPPRETVENTAMPSPPLARSKCLFLPIATRSFVLIASRARRNAPLRSRHLRDRRRSI
eukprot:2083936-Pleurochrysis_carterae.AAC.1